MIEQSFKVGRWCVAGLLRAEGQFRRIKGHRAMPGLIEAPEDITRGQPLEASGTWRENLRRNRRAFPPRTGQPPRKERSDFGEGSTSERAAA
jgi:hypothetical protein